jgi:proteasome assembly chaperone (PAC2) family protein
MNILRKEVKGVEKAPVEIDQSPPLRNSSLLVLWQTRDVGQLTCRVVDILKEALGGKEIAEIKPSGCFTFGGVRFKNDLVRMPQSKFWAYGRQDLLIFKSDEPEFEHFHFLNTLLDVSKAHYQMKELVTLNAFPSLTAHTRPRKIFAVFNQSELKERCEREGLDPLTWEGPPALSSYLLWVAQRKEIPGVSLWLEIPFYLSASGDPRAVQSALSFFDKKFSLDLDLEALNLEIREQDEKIGQLRRGNAEMDRYLTLLETGLGLEEEEQLKLAKGIYDALEKRT